MKKEFSPEILTAFVLGQLGEAERRQVEAAAKEDSALAAELIRLRRTATYLHANMGSDAELKLSPARRGALANALAQKSGAASGGRGWRGWAARPALWGSVATAALVLIVVWQVGVPPSEHQAMDALQKSAPPSTEAPAAPADPAEPIDAPVVTAAEPEAPASPPPVERKSEAALAKPARQVGALSAEVDSAAREEAAPAVVEAPPEIELPSERQAAKAAVAASPSAPAAAGAPAAPAAAEEVEMVATMVQVGGMHIRITLPPPLEPETERKIAMSVARKMKSDEAVLAEIKRNQAKGGASYMITGEIEKVGTTCMVYLSVLRLEAYKPVTDRLKAASCAPDALLEAFEELAEDIASRQP